MNFPYTHTLIDNAFTYTTYRQYIDQQMAQPAQDEAAEKMKPYIQKNVQLMQHHDHIYRVCAPLHTALSAAPATTWLVLTEGWCGDAAFNIPLMAAVEKALPGKIKLRLLLRDQHLDLMDAHLTDGGRSIPKLVVLNNDLQKLGTWGPKPAALHQLNKEWKAEGLLLKELIARTQQWYDADNTQMLQQELTTLVKSYSASPVLL